MAGTWRDPPSNGAHDGPLSEGEVVAENLLGGNQRTADFSGLASMVYTIPRLGWSG